jgi:hypothetical protein
MLISRRNRIKYSDFTVKYADFTVKYADFMASETCDTYEAGVVLRPRRETARPRECEWAFIRAADSFH